MLQPLHLVEEKDLPQIEGEILPNTLLWKEGTVFQPTRLHHFSFGWSFCILKKKEDNFLDITLLQMMKTEYRQRREGTAPFKI